MLRLLIRCLSIKTGCGFVVDLILQTPLNGQLHKSDGLSVRELAPCSKVIVRGGESAMSAALRSAVGLGVEVKANCFVSYTQGTLFWLGPNEWLIYNSGTDVGAFVHQLKNTLPRGESAAVNVSDYYTVIQIQGSKARAVLASGTPFDVHPRVFKPGQCAQTRFGNASVLLSCQADDTYDVQVRWSFAEYLWKYLCRVGNYV